MRPSVHFGMGLLLGCCLLQPARGEVYSYTAADGAVHLTNVPADSRYTLLLLAEDGSVGELDPPPPAKAPDSLAAKPKYDRIVEKVARNYGLESALLHAVISVESRYNPRAVSPMGAKGLMQLMPGTARRFGVADIFDPLQNLHGGARYLQYLLNLFDSDLSLALAAYNSGEGTVLKHGKRIPPRRETLDYVPRVLGFYKQYRGRH